MISKRILLALTPLLLISCSKTNFTKNECEDLSIKKFKGYQTESYQFDNYCLQYKLHYTQARCKKALNQLILGANLSQLTAAHGARISECFTKNDLKKFGTKE